MTMQYIWLNKPMWKKICLYAWLMKHSRSLNFADMSTSFSNCHAEFTVPLLRILKYAWLFLIIEFSSRIYDVFFSARFLTASFAPKTRRKNSVRWNMLLSFINAEMSHDSLAGEKARRSLMTDVHGTTQRKSSFAIANCADSQHCNANSRKKIYEARVEVVSE